MPIYEYECKKCHELTEVMQKMSDPGPTKCPKCGSKRIERVMSQTSFQLKGEGWYITDYSRKDKDAKEKSKKKRDDSGSDSKGESKAETKTETKSEAKTETKSDKADAKKAKPSAKSD